MLRVFLTAAVITAAAPFAATGTAPAGRTTETYYYGKTGQGLGVSIPVRGTQIPRDSRAYLVWKMIRSLPDGLEFHPGLVASMSFRGGKLVFHRLEHLPGGTIEVWFQARLSQGGKVMTGTFRERDVGYSARPKDSGTIRLRASAWASLLAGYEWRGATADARPLQAAASYRMVPGNVIVDGKREQEPKYMLKLLPATRQLACRLDGGTSTKIAVTLPALTAELNGSDDLDNTFSKHGGLFGVAAGSATSNGATVKAELYVRRLAWQGTGLAATGTLAYQGTLSGELGQGTCARTSSSFTRRPR